MFAAKFKPEKSTGLLEVTVSFTWQPVLTTSWIESEERSPWLWLDFKSNQNQFYLHRKLYWDKGKRRNGRNLQEESQRRFPLSGRTDRHAADVACTEQQNHKLHWQNIWFQHKIISSSNLKAMQMWRDGKSEESDDPAEPRVWRDRSVNMWGSRSPER